MSDDRPVVGTKDEGMTTKRLGRGLGVAVAVAAVVGISSLPAFADSTCYVNCSPPTTITTGGGGGGGGGTGSGGGPGTGGSGGSGGSGGTRPPVTKSSGGSSGSGSGGANLTSSGSGGTLAFTGADIEEMTIGGAGALIVGTLLVRRSRNRRRIET
ncbi:MAG: hypothetical protein ACRDY1_00680 [Acidimicrobiales bacterium]